MTLSAVGEVPTPNAKSGQRGKDMQAAAHGFDEALAGNGKRKPAHADTREQAEAVEPVWKTRAYVANLDLGANSALTDAEPDSNTEDLALPADGAILPDAGPTVDDAMVASPPQKAPAESASPADIVKAMLKELGGEGTTQKVDAAPDGDDPDTEAQDPRRGDARSRAPADNPAVASKPATGTGAIERQAPPPAPSQAPAGGRAVETPARSGGTGDAPPAPEQEQRIAEGRPPAASAARIVEELGQQSRPSRETMPAGPANEATAARVNVLGFSGALAPAPASTPLLGATAAGVVAAIEGDPTWRQAATDPSLNPAPRNPSSLSGVNTLRIQLNPAELGMVTARLTANGSQLSIEIQVESNDARQRLANDSDAILKALRSIGYDVEKVTIQHQPQNTQPSPQANTGAGREHFQSEQQTRDGANARGQGGQDTSERGNEGSARGRGETASDRPGSGVYI